MTNLVARPLAGYRHWAVDASGRLLATTEAFSLAWTPPETRGAWASPERPAASFCQWAGHAGLCREAFDCTCGLHAYAEPNHWPRSGLLHGAVVAWGRIILHDGGFRAEYARPIAFLDQPSAWSERAVERYGLPVLAPDELVAYAAWHGDAPALAGSPSQETK